MNEEWRPYPDAPSWMISSFGRVIGPRGRIMKAFRTADGYETMRIAGRFSRVHRLVAATFLRRPEEGEQVNHINFDKADNRVDNLEWCTPKENVRHAIAGDHFHFSKCGPVTFKFTESEVVFIRETLAAGAKTPIELANHFNVSVTTINAIARHHTYRHVGGPKVTRTKRERQRTLTRESNRAREIRARKPEVVKLRHDNLTFRQIGALLGIPKSCAHRLYAEGDHA